MMAKGTGSLDRTDSKPGTSHGAENLEDNPVKRSVKPGSTEKATSLKIELVVKKRREWTLSGLGLKTGTPTLRTDSELEGQEA